MMWRSHTKLIGRVAIAGCVVAVPCLTRAQTIPVTRTVASADSTATSYRPTAADIERRLWLHMNGRLAVLTDDNYIAPPDSVRPILLQRTEQWVTQIRAARISPLERDKLAVILVSTGRGDEAVQEFERQLATPRLSATEKGYTLLLATEAFAGTGTAEGLKTARSYMSRLDALPGDFATWQYRAHTTLGYAYYHLGESGAAAEQFARAFERVKAMPFSDRRVGNDELVTYATVIAGQPDGRARIDSMANALLAALTPSPQLIARDSSYIGYGMIERQRLSVAITQASRLGAVAPAVIATHWMNTQVPSAMPMGVPNSPPNARALRLDDGAIRILQFGEFSCVACVNALPVMDALRDSLPKSVQIWYVTTTEGVWNGEMPEADEEANKLRDFYIGRMHVKLPIALWAGPRDSTIDGGTLPRKSPNVTAYGTQTFPTFVIVDGRGIVRHIEIGVTADGMERMKKLVGYLAAESSRASANP